MKEAPQTRSAQVYVFSGEDEYLLVQDAENLVKRLMPPENLVLGLEIIEAQARLTSEAAAIIVKCIEALRTPGFMGARKVVWLKRANFLDRSVIASSKEVKEILNQLTEVVKTSLPDGNIFVVAANAVDRSAAFFKVCHAKGEIYQQTALKPYEKDQAAAAFTRSVLRKNKLHAPSPLVTSIVNLVGTDSRQLSQEISKLAAYIHPRQEVTEDDVFAIVAATRESNSFHLADAVGFRNLPKAIAILRQLLFQKESEIGLVMGLESHFRYLLIWKEMTDGKMTGEEKSALESLMITKKGRPPHEYFLEKLTQQAKLFSRQELESARKAILETRLKLASSSGLEKILLEKLLVQLCCHETALRDLEPD